jgi:hypothetical protein
VEKRNRNDANDQARAAGLFEADAVFMTASSTFKAR